MFMRLSKFKYVYPLSIILPLNIYLGELCLHSELDLTWWLVDRVRGPWAGAREHTSSWAPGNIDRHGHGQMLSDVFRLELKTKVC